MSKTLVHSLFFGVPSADKALLFAGIKQTAAHLDKGTYEFVFWCQAKHREAMLERLAPEILVESIRTFEDLIDQLRADPKFTEVVPVLQGIIDQMEGIECNVFAAELLNSVISYLHGGYRLNTSMSPTDGTKPINLPVSDRPALVLMSAAALEPYVKLSNHLDFWMDYFPTPKNDVAELILKLQLETYNLFNQIKMELPRKICDILKSGDAEGTIKAAITEVFGADKCQTIYDLIYKQANGSYNIAAAKRMIKADLYAPVSSHQLIKIALDILHTYYQPLFDFTTNPVDEVMYARFLAEVKLASQKVKFAQSPIMGGLFDCISDARTVAELNRFLAERLSISVAQIEHLTQFVFCKAADGSFDLAKTKREFNPYQNPNVMQLLNANARHFITIFQDRIPGHELAKDFSAFGTVRSITVLPNIVIRAVLANADTTEVSQLFNHGDTSFAIDLIVADLHNGGSSGKYWTHTFAAQDLNITKVHGLSGWTNQIDHFERGIERYIFQSPAAGYHLGLFALYAAQFADRDDDFLGFGSAAADDYMESSLGAASERRDSYPAAAAVDLSPARVMGEASASTGQSAVYSPCLFAAQPEQASSHAESTEAVNETQAQGGL